MCHGSRLCLNFLQQRNISRTTNTSHSKYGIRVFSSKFQHSEALPVCVCGGGGGGGGAGTCCILPLEKMGLVPQKQNLDFVCSQFPKIACVPLFPLFLGFLFPCSPEKKMPLFPCPESPGRTSLVVRSDCICFQSIFFSFFSVLKKCLTLLFLEHSTSFSKQISRRLQGTSQMVLQTQTAASPGVGSSV